jgi:hypothetical protein
MKKEPEDIQQFLPYGEMLRGFMEQSFIGKGDLKNLLRNRGVFTSQSEKSDVIPILSATILRPSEFDLLRETQNSKEDNPKIITQTVEWSSSKTIFDALPEALNFPAILNLEFNNYRLVGMPEFTPAGKDLDKVKLDFTVERIDYAKSWSQTSNEFHGSLEIQKMEVGGDIKIVITHTASETKQVASKVASSLIRHFKDEGFIDPSAELEKILFSRLSNADRIRYLLSLARNPSSLILHFQDIVNLEFSPDPSIPLPEGIDWMEKKIQDLKLNGNELHKTLFFKNQSYYDYLHLYQIDSKFKFDTQGLPGSCVISIGFPDYGRVKNLDAEMEVKIRSIDFDFPPKDNSRISIKKILLKEIEDQKIIQFKKFFKSVR